MRFCLSGYKNVTRVLLMIVVGRWTLVVGRLTKSHTVYRGGIFVQDNTATTPPIVEEFLRKARRRVRSLLNVGEKLAVRRFVQNSPTRGGVDPTREGVKRKGLLSQPFPYLLKL